MTDQNCLFCSIVEGAIPAEVVHETENVLVFRDVGPQAPSHLLVIPKRHIASLVEAGEDDRELLGEVLLAAGHVARAEGVSEPGFRCVLNTGDDSGQTVHHLHMHVLGGRSMAWPPG